MDLASSLQCGWFAAHLIAVTTALMLRVYSGRRLEHVLQIIYVCQLGLISIAALAGRQLCWRLSEVSAATIAVMVVAAVLEAGPQRATQSVGRQLG